MAAAIVKATTTDPDGNGLRNLEENVRHTDLNIKTGGLSIMQTRNSFGAEVTWTQGAELNDVQTPVEHSADMRVWTAAGVSLNDCDPVDDFQTFTARITGEAGLADERYMPIRWSLGR